MQSKILKSAKASKANYITVMIGGIVGIVMLVFSASAFFEEQSSYWPDEQLLLMTGAAAVASLVLILVEGNFGNKVREVKLVADENGLSGTTLSGSLFSPKNESFEVAYEDIISAKSDMQGFTFETKIRNYFCPVADAAGFYTLVAEKCNLSR